MKQIIVKFSAIQNVINNLESSARQWDAMRTDYESKSKDADDWDKRIAAQMITHCKAYSDGIKFALSELKMEFHSELSEIAES